MITSNYLNKWDEKSEYEPDINHLDIGGHGEGVGDTDEPINNKVDDNQDI